MSKKLVAVRRSIGVACVALLACSSQADEPAPVEQPAAPIKTVASMMTTPGAGGPSSSPVNPQTLTPTGSAFGADPTAGGAGVAGAMQPQTVVPPAPDKAEPCNVTGCPVGLECAASGICRTPPPACLSDADCAGGQRCGLTGDCLVPGGCRVQQDCAEAEACRQQVCTLGSDCGQTELVIDPVVPNVLVLLDVSQSMSDPPTAGGMMPKIRIADSAMQQMAATYRGRIRWGLAMFSGDAACGPPANVIAPAADMEDTVTMQISQQGPAGFTPINASVAAIQAADYLKDPNHPNYLLFISDGGETCPPDPSDLFSQMANEDTRQRIEAMKMAGIGTFVVGFGDGVDVVWLNQFAQAGGYPNPNGTQDMATMMQRTFYAADNAAGLEQALSSILGSVVGCDYTLAGPPEDPAAVWAFLDDVMVDRDTPDGWKLDTATNTVSFTGQSCQRLQSGDARDIDVVFGCPEPVLE